MKRLIEEWKKHGPKNFRIFQRIEGNRSIITVADRNNNLVDQFAVPNQSGIKYCLDHPNGQYYRRLKAAADFAGIPLPPIEEKPKKQISQKIKNNRSTITVIDKSGNLVDQFDVPSQSGIRYCLEHPTGKHYKRLKAAATFAQVDLPEPRQITARPKAKPKRQFNLSLEVDLLEKLRKEADHEGKSITGFIRELLEERLLDI